MAVKRSKASFRALRELVGITQADLANMLGYDVETVKRIEKPHNLTWQPREEAWQKLKQLRRTQVAQLDYAMQLAERAQDSTAPLHIELPYYRTQGAYDAEGRDAGSFRLANRVAGEVAEALDEMGVDVEIFYAGEEARNSWETVKDATR